jgi:uncharacterized membrane protein YkoI
MLPVLCIAMLSIGAVHAKENDKKKAAGDEVVPARTKVPEKADPPKSSTKVVSLDRVIEQIQEKYKARVVRYDRIQRGGRLVYELKVLSDERMRTVRVDAETGKEL